MLPRRYWKIWSGFPFIAKNVCVSIYGITRYLAYIQCHCAMYIASNRGKTLFRFYHECGSSSWALCGVYLDSRKGMLDDSIYFLYWSGIGNTLSFFFGVFVWVCERKTNNTQIMRLSNVHFVVVFFCAFHDANTYRECRVEKLFLLW